MRAAYKGGKDYKQGQSEREEEKRETLPGCMMAEMAHSDSKEASNVKIKMNEGREGEPKGNSRVQRKVCNQIRQRFNESSRLPTHHSRSLWAY